MVVKKFHEKKEYSLEVLKHLHDAELMILKDFMQFCDKHEIEFFLDGGSLLGCIRHGGFIPWDDDVDVILLRNHYETFLKYQHELSDKYDILNSENFEDYCRLYSKLSLKGTKNSEIFDINTDFSFGINIDIFVLDNVPQNKIAGKLFKLHRDVFYKLLMVYEQINCDVYSSKNREKLGHLIGGIFKIFNINNKTLKKLGEKLINTSKNIQSDYVANLSTSYSLGKFHRDIFRKIELKKFESIKAPVPIEYDDYLTMIYGDYMKLPPKDQQVNHAFDYIDFGKY